MFPLIQLGPFALQVPGLILLAGGWLSLEVADRRASRRGGSAEDIDRLVFIGLVAGAIGARLWYALRFPDAYLADPLALLSLNFATTAPLEGAATGLLAAWIYGQRRKLPFWKTMDVLVPGIALFMVPIALANFASGDAFGAPTSAAWGIELWGEARHPTQLYAAALGAVIFVVIWRLQNVSVFDGFLSLTWLFMAASSRLFLEAFRGDSAVILDVVRLPQVLSLTVMAVSLYGLHALAKRAGQPHARIPAD
jgi:phosphatidylglycerol:prolipoprotein diacylglycerol transferase